MRVRSAAVVASITAGIGLSMVTPPPALARTLTEPTTGLTVTAPKGYHLGYRNGVFTLRGKGRYAQFMSFRSPLSLKATGQTVLSGIKAKRVKGTTSNSTQFKARAKVRGRSVTVRLRRSGGVTQLVIFGGGDKARATATGSALRPSSAGPPGLRAAALLPSQIRALDTILRSRRGEPVRDIDIGIPMRTFQAPVQNGASASVPDLPGWQYGGTDTGYLYGGHPTDGGFELGAFILVNYPGAPSPIAQYPTAQIQQPRDALINVLSAWERTNANANVAFTQVNPLNGTDGNLGPGYLSQAFEALLTVNGVPYRGIFNIGVTDNAGSWFAWGLYYSFAIARVGGPSGILTSLLTTWGSWNNSAASLARLEAALRTVQSTRPIGGGPIDPDVFQRAADAWDEYIRGP